jgi:hypothetical protein
MSGLQGFASQFNPLLLEKNLFAVILAMAGLVFCAFGERWLVNERPLADQLFNPLARTAIWLSFTVAIVVAASSAEIPFLYFQF